MISRRDFLGGTSALIGLNLINIPSAVGKEQPRPFFYTIEDYVNPVKQPSEMGKLYLAELKEPTVLVAWATWCRPCVDKIPKYNALYKQYGEKLRFVSALQEYNIDSPPDVPPLPEAQYMGMCVNNALVSKYSWGSSEFNQAREELRQGRIKSPELATLVTDCGRNTIEAYNPTYSRPRERQSLQQSIERLQQQDKWPSFPTYFLDDQDTSKYLGGKTAFFVTLFRDGRKIKTLEGKSEKQVEKEFVRLLK
ncbi:MAG: hypothetical protein Q7K45_04750 [Nanoarchaeota archaeon]|nr:hypothetical protein [Nanoarchaeota archaeon]